MVDLIAKTPAAGLLPVTHGSVTLRELALERMTSVAPFNGQQKAVSAALKTALGAGLPDTGRLLAGKTGDVIWAGQGLYFVTGARLGDMPAALSDQSDAWCAVALEGAGALDVMARACPLDLRAMDEGDTARSLLFHMNAVIIRRSDGFDLMVFRSMAKTLVHELATVMRSVAAQSGPSPH